MISDEQAQAITFSAETRKNNLSRMDYETFDLLIIGGGITGAGIASEAARRGYKVALVEKGDFASGASSKSSKLIHGGLRYLANLKFGLVYQACQQRRQLLERAPHLVQLLPFVLPIYKDSVRPTWQIQTAMWLYDVLATIPDYAKSQAWPNHQMWPASQVLTKEPHLNGQGLLKAAYYYDCLVDDARLTLITLLDAHRAGAIVANYAQVMGFLQTTYGSAGHVVGAQIRNRLNGQEIELKARIVISAVGPWTDQLLPLSRRTSPPWLRPTKGVHIIIPRQRLQHQAALTFNAPKDGRFMVAVPWRNHTIIGATDTNYQGDPDTVFADAGDVDYILTAARHAFPAAQLDEDDIISTYAGLRPLITDGVSPGATGPNHCASRQHRIHEVMPGLLTIAGGKFTTHRVMAQAVVDKAAYSLAYNHRKYFPDLKNGSHARLPGGVDGEWETYQAQQRRVITARAHLPTDIARHLITTYGTEVAHILKYVIENPLLANRLTPHLPVIKAQVVYAMRQEMALTLEDILSRRTQVLALSADQGLSAIEAVADLMATELDWTDQERAAQIIAYQHLVAANHRWRNSNNQAPKFTLQTVKGREENNHAKK